MTQNRYQQGFTLLELLVALSLFALIGIGAHALLQSVLKGREIAQSHAVRLAQVQKAIWIMTQDVRQMETPGTAVARDNYTLTFTRRGWSNPLLHNRSDRLAIAYALQDDKLMRYYWPPEQPQQSPQIQTLLEGVSNFAISTSAPRLFEITMDVKPYGILRRAIEVTEP